METICQASRYQIAYLPRPCATSAPLILLALGDLCSTQPTLDPSAGSRDTAIIGTPWAHLAANNGSKITLSFDHYLPAVSLAAAQKLGHERKLFMLEKPMGELRLFTAFDGESFLVDDLFTACCTLANYTELDSDSSPFPHASAVHLRYTFTLTRCPS